MLRPADDYISSFVKEVNRGRVIFARTVMTPLNGKQPSGPALSADAYLEEVAKTMTDANSSAAHVVDEQGMPIGHLDIHGVISAMVTPAVHKAA